MLASTSNVKERGEGGVGERARARAGPNFPPDRRECTSVTGPPITARVQLLLFKLLILLPPPPPLPPEDFGSRLRHSAFKV